MTSDKDKLISYNSLEKEKNVTFGNKSLVVIMGKGYVFIKEKVKVGNVMYVDGLKHKIFSVIQMCDQGNEVVFRSKECVVYEIECPFFNKFVNEESECRRKLKPTPQREKVSRYGKGRSYSMKVMA